MALTDLIRKKSTGKSASAIAAIPAIREERIASKIAGIARIAVANPNAAEVGILEKLRQFRFDLVAHDIEEGYSADDLERVNNLAWEFMQVDGMEFSAAIHLAAQIVAECNVAASERAYEDVQALWRKLTRNLD
jgi:hypothetical protein